MERHGHQHTYENYSRYELKNLSTDQLHERLLADMQPHSDYEGRAKISAAFDLAEQMHAMDFRASGPYIAHPLRVVNRLHTYMGVKDPEVLAAALLHDTVEDHAEDLIEIAGHNLDDIAPEEVREKALSVIGDVWGPNTQYYVDQVSNPPFEGTKEERNQQYKEHIEEAIEDPTVFLIKLSDFIDNAVGLYHTNNATMVKKLSVKYEPLYDVFVSRLLREDHGLTPEVTDRLYKQLLKGKERNRELIEISNPY